MKRTVVHAEFLAVLLAATAAAAEAQPASQEGAPSDGSAWLEGDCSRHVIRGGSWRDGPKEMRSAFRFPLAERSGFKGANFRVARELAP